MRHQFYRIEKSNSVSAAKDKRAISKYPRCPVVELIASYSVGFEPVDKAPDAAVIFCKTVLGADPEVALKVFFYAAYIAAGSAGKGREF